jgi:predicted RNA-binding protein with RPS1 domain
MVEKAIKIIKDLTAEPEIGKIYLGNVRKVAEFGAFVEIFPGTDGLRPHLGLAEKRVNRVEDIVREGDEVEVMISNVDRDGKIKLTRKELLPKPEGWEPPRPASAATAVIAATVVDVVVTAAETVAADASAGAAAIATAAATVARVVAADATATVARVVTAAAALPPRAAPKAATRPSRNDGRGLRPPLHVKDCECA